MCAMQLDAGRREVGRVPSHEERNAQRAQARITPAQSGAERSGRVPRESPLPPPRGTKEVEEERARAAARKETEAASVKGAAVPSRSGAPDQRRPRSQPAGRSRGRTQRRRRRSAMDSRASAQSSSGRLPISAASAPLAGGERGHGWRAGGWEEARVISRAAVASASSGGGVSSTTMSRTILYTWPLLLVWLLVAGVESVPQRGPVHSTPIRPPSPGPFRGQTMPIMSQSPSAPPSAPRPTMKTASTPSLQTAQSRVARPYQGPHPRPPPFPNPHLGNNGFQMNHNQFPANNGINGNIQFSGNNGISVNHNQFPGSHGMPQNHNQFPGNGGIPPNPNHIPMGDQFQKYNPPNDAPQYAVAQSSPPASIQPQIPPQAAFLKTYAQMYQHYSPSHHRIPSYSSHHHHDPVPHYHSHGHHGHYGYGHHHGHHHHHRAPPNELLDLMSPLKKEDAMFPPSSNHPGSLYGIMVPLMLLGISIPAIGFVYTYFSRRSFDSALVHNILPSEEKLDYYFHILQRGIECFQNSDKCSTKIEHARVINSSNSS